MAAHLSLFNRATDLIEQLQSLHRFAHEQIVNPHRDANAISDQLSAIETYEATYQELLSLAQDVDNVSPLLKCIGTHLSNFKLLRTSLCGRVEAPIDIDDALADICDELSDICIRVLNTPGKTQFDAATEAESALAGRIQQLMIQPHSTDRQVERAKTFLAMIEDLRKI